MKRHLMIGLLTMLVLAPAATVFSADTPTMLQPEQILIPEQQEQLGIEAPMCVWEFGQFFNNFGGLSSIAYVTNRDTVPHTIVATTIPQGQTFIQRAFTIPAAFTGAFDAASLNCPAGLPCQLVFISPGSPLAFFNLILQMNSGAQVVGFVQPFYFTCLTQ